MIPVPIKFTQQEQNAIDARNAGMDNISAFKLIFEDNPKLIEDKPNTALGRYANRFFSAVDEKDDETILKCRKIYDQMAEKKESKKRFKKANEHLKKAAESNGYESIALNPAEIESSNQRQLAERFRESLNLSEKVDSLVIVGTAQTLMSEAINAMYNRKKVIKEHHLEGALDDTALPFSKLILDAIRLANEMLSPYQAKEIASADPNDALVIKLLGIRDSIGVNPDDYTAPIPPGAITYQQNKEK